MNEVAFLIDGQSLPAQDGRSFQRIDPVKQSPATQAAAAAGADVSAAVRSAAAAFPAWAATGPGRRRELLLRAADALLSHQAEFVKCMIEETGATEG
jgi:vanillin dehydrogenase